MDKLDILLFFNLCLVCNTIWTEVIVAAVSLCILHLNTLTLGATLAEGQSWQELFVEGREFMSNVSIYFYFPDK